MEEQQLVDLDDTRKRELCTLFSLYSLFILTAVS